MSRIPASALAASVLLLQLPSCRSLTHSGDEVEEDRIIAQVGEEPVPRGLFEAYLRDNINLMDDTPRAGNPLEAAADERERGGLSDEIRSRLLDRFLQEQALLNEARQAGIQASEADLARFGEALGLGPLESMHEGAPLTEREYLRTYLEDCYIIKTYLEKVVLARTAATEAEARAYYDANPRQFTRPDRYRLRLLRVDTLAEAKQLHRQVATGQSTFLEVAQSLSEESEGEQGKDLGLWRADELPENVAEVVAGLQEGKVSEVVENPDGAFDIYFLEAKTEGDTLPFDQVSTRLLKKISREKRDQVLASYLRSLEGRSKIVLVEDNLGFLYRERSASLEASPPAESTESPDPASSPSGGAS